MIIFLINFVKCIKNIKLIFRSLNCIIEHKNIHLLYDFLIHIIVCIFIFQLHKLLFFFDLDITELHVLVTIEHRDWHFFCLCGKFRDVSIRNPVEFVDTGRVDGFLGGGNLVFNVSFLDYNIQVVLSFLYFILFLSFVIWLMKLAHVGAFLLHQISRFMDLALYFLIFSRSCFNLINLFRKTLLRVIINFKITF